MTYPISRELRRQKDQGFIEPKQGIISPNLRFRIEEAGNVVINAKGLRYRLDRGETEPRMGETGKELLGMPVEHYAPFRNLIARFVPLIGSGGLAKIGLLGKSGERGWVWEDSSSLALDEALNKYRWAQFSYEINQTRNSLRFEPDHDPNNPFGELILSYGDAGNPWDLPAMRIGRIESTLDEMDPTLFPNIRR